MIVTIDTGGTKTLITSFNNDGVMGESTKFPTPKDPQEYVDVLTQEVRERYQNQSVDAVILAIPGVIKNGTAVWCQNLGWENFEATQLLGNILPGVPFYIQNDANLAGLSETYELESNPQLSLYITVSTGIGSGFVTAGEIDPGLQYSEAGHALIEYDGKVQQWESFASGRAIVDAYHQFARDITDENIWREVADRLSRGFLALIPITQPDVIIFGGSVGTYFERYGHFLEEILKEKLPPHMPCPQLVQAQHPEEAVVYGCYRFAVNHLAHTTAHNA
ncbi:MAG: ROK family protein [Candidatus Saccharimonas sp.]